MDRAAGRRRDARDPVALLGVDADRDEMELELRFRPGDVARGLARILTAVVDVVVDQHDMRIRHPGEHLGRLADNPGDWPFAAGVVFLQGDVDSGRIAVGERHQQLDVGAVGRATVAKRHQPVAGGRWHLGQRRLEAVAGKVELGALGVAVELAPHRPGTIEHDDGRRRLGGVGGSGTGDQGERQGSDREGVDGQSTDGACSHLSSLADRAHHRLHSKNRAASSGAVVPEAVLD